MILQHLLTVLVVGHPSRRYILRHAWFSVSECTCALAEGPGSLGEGGKKTAVLAVGRWGEGVGLVWALTLIHYVTLYK